MVFFRVVLFVLSFVFLSQFVIADENEWQLMDRSEIEANKDLLSCAAFAINAANKADPDNKGGRLVFASGNARASIVEASIRTDVDVIVTGHGYKFQLDLTRVRLDKIVRFSFVVDLSNDRHFSLENIEEIPISRDEL